MCISIYIDIQPIPTQMIWVGDNQLYRYTPRIRNNLDLTNKDWDRPNRGGKFPKWGTPKSSRIHHSLSKTAMV